LKTKKIEKQYYASYYGENAEDQGKIKFPKLTVRSNSIRINEWYGMWLPPQKKDLLSARTLLANRAHPCQHWPFGEIGTGNHVLKQAEKASTGV